MLGARCRVCCLGAGLWRLLALCVSCWVPQLTPGCGVEASTHRAKVEQPVAPSHWLGQGYQAATNPPLSLWPWVQEQVSGLMLLRACVCVFMCMCVCVQESCVGVNQQLCVRTETARPHDGSRFFWGCLLYPLFLCNY